MALEHEASRCLIHRVESISRARQGLGWKRARRGMKHWCASPRGREREKWCAHLCLCRRRGANSRALRECTRGTGQVLSSFSGAFKCFCSCLECRKKLPETEAETSFLIDLTTRPVLVAFFFRDFIERFVFDPHLSLSCFFLINIHDLNNAILILVI